MIMNYKEYLNYYNDCNSLKKLTNKKLKYWSVKVSESDIEVLYKDDIKKIIKLWNYKYIIINWSKLFYTIKKEVYYSYKDFKINNMSVFSL